MGAGRDFLVRYICLNWVVGLRVFLLLVVPIVVVNVYAEELLFGEIPEETTIVGAFAGAAFEVVLFWRLAVHIRSLSNTSHAA